MYKCMAINKTNNNVYFKFLLKDWLHNQSLDAAGNNRNS